MGKSKESTPEAPDRVGAFPLDASVYGLEDVAGNVSEWTASFRAGDRSSEAVRRHLDPVPRVALGQSLAAAGIPSAMIDISDGLAADLGHILAASGRGAVVKVDSLPLSAGFKAAVAGGTPARYDLPVAGGEDTVCPHCGATVIRRRGFSLLAQAIEHGRCRGCGATYRLADLDEELIDEAERELANCRVDRI